MKLELHIQPEKLDELIIPETLGEIRDLYASLPALVQEQEYGLEREVVILDLETTGLMPRSDRITEVGMIRMRGTEIVEKYSQLINPGKEIDSYITELTGISNEMVADAPSIAEASNAIRSFLGDADIVAHNAHFDKQFIENSLGLISNNWIDSVRLMRIGVPRLRSYSLGKLADWLGTRSPHAHRALADCEMLTGVWRLALAGLSTIDPAVLNTILKLQSRYYFDENEWIERVLEASGSKANAFSLKALRRLQTSDEAKEAKLDAFEQRLKYENKQKLHSYFEEIAAHEAAFERRASQEQMSAAVYQAFEGAQCMVAEAPTGVGKSLAYLMPSVLLAKENDITVGIATKTNALADQLISSEIPRLQKRLEKLGKPEANFSFAAVKGYENYFCMRKVDRLLRSKSEVPSALEHVLSWISQSPEGDLSRFSGNIFSARAELVATQAECTKRRCPFYAQQCYIHAARAKAKAADIVITNHSLLLRDSLSAAKVLPPIRYWIVDEAHSFEGETRRQTESVFNGDELASQIESLLMPNSGLIARINKMGAEEGASLEERSETGLSVKSFSDLCEKSLFKLSAFNRASADAYRPRPTRRNRDDSKTLPRSVYPEEYLQETWLDEQERNSKKFSELVPLAEDMMFSLEDLLVLSRRLSSGMSLDEKLANSDLYPELNRFRDSLNYALEALNLIFFEPDSDNYYSVVPLPGRRGLNFVAAALEVGPIISSNLIPQLHSIIFTSATLAVSNSFEVIKSRIGLDLVEPERVVELALSPAFNLARQMKIFVTKDMPEPRSSDYISTLSGFLTRLHRVTEGGVLTLFTNRREMEESYKLVSPELKREGLELISQMSGSRNLLRSLQFVEEYRTSLFALKSFWEGFDAQGHTLRCVVIPKIPFAQPGTSLSRERNLRYGAAAWRRFDLPDAILEMKQAVGRLIRSNTDRGHVILGDSRIVLKGYGKTVLRSLPVEAKIMKIDELIAEIEKDYASGMFDDES